MLLLQSWRRVIAEARSCACRREGDTACSTAHLRLNIIMAARLGLTKALQVLAENRLPTIGMLNAFPAEFGFASGEKS